ncbi:MAG TPA: histidine kinase [Candidatus Acidoferrum sp.]|nr:histidine kinase [Candidatus Acidoferrum sp.]
MNLTGSPRSQHKIYRFAALPIAGLLAYLLHTPQGLTWLEAGILGFALASIGELISLPAWYSCRVAPIDRTPIWRLLATHVVAAQILSFLWLGAGKLLARALSYVPALQGIDARFDQRLTIVYGAGCVFYLLAVSFHYVSLAQDASREFETRALETGIRARDAELKALKAQINPHFLFNSLNSISALTSIDPTRARDMCVLLGDFLRLTLGLGEKASVHFSEELDLLQKYMAIEKVRFGDRLRMQQTIQEESKTCLLPPLLLQPLVENAVKHGIASLPEGGEIRLAAERQNGRLAIVVENSWDPEAPPRRSGGMGLKNVQRRLEARYGKDASLLVNAEGELFQVSLSLPAESEEKA